MLPVDWRSAVDSKPPQALRPFACARGARCQTLQALVASQLGGGASGLEEQVLRDLEAELPGPDSTLRHRGVQELNTMNERKKTMSASSRNPKPQRAAAARGASSPRLPSCKQRGTASEGADKWLFGMRADYALGPMHSYICAGMLWVTLGWA